MLCFLNSGLDLSPTDILSQKGPPHGTPVNLLIIFLVRAGCFALCSGLFMVFIYSGINYMQSIKNGSHVRWLKDHILHLFPGTFIRCYVYDPMTLPSKCSLSSPDD